MQVTRRKDGKGPANAGGIKGKPVLTDSVDEGKRIFLQSSISILGLGKRAENSLREAGIETVGDLVQKTEEEVSGIKEVRQKGMFTIKWAFAERGVSFATSSADDGQSAICLSEVMDPRLGTDIGELKLLGWTEKALQAAGIRQVGQLSGMTAQELYQIKELGRGRIREIRKAIARFGITLAGEGIDSQAHFMKLGAFEDLTPAPIQMTVQNSEDELSGQGRYARMGNDELLEMARTLMVSEGIGSKEALGREAPILFRELEGRLGRLGLVEFEESVRKDIAGSATSQQSDEQLSSLLKDARAEIEKLLETVKPENLQATLKLLDKL